RPGCPGRAGAGGRPSRADLPATEPAGRAGRRHRRLRRAARPGWPADRGQRRGPVRAGAPAVNGPAGRHRAVTAALAATVLVALAGLVLTGLEWGSLAITGAVGNIGAEAG